MAVAAAFNSVAAATTSTAASVAAATAASVATTTAADAAFITDNAQQSRNQWMPICPRSTDIIRWIGEEKGWSKSKISRKIKQQLRNELAERNREQYINIQSANNLKRIVRLSGWSRGKIEHKIRQRIHDELAVQQQQQQVAATGVNTIPAIEKPRQILCHSLLQCIMENCLQTFRAAGTQDQGWRKSAIRQMEVES
ncbi:hypothetical protein LPJ66_008464 [Kickxella alabastrina]|uniref:Uncharacterized protein n=1 Tax=Kickxella alabastrina TaxID=61397 RepID=A0ACC1I6J8_9FUNG|nr:hypothetical protein LPJ66_008464 [Kickxella alabastrina]